MNCETHRVLSELCESKVCRLGPSLAMLLFLLFLSGAALGRETSDLFQFMIRTFSQEDNLKILLAESVCLKSPSGQIGMRR